MYRIAVCDDEKVFSDSLSGLAGGILRENGILFALDTYACCDSLLDAMERGERYHILFLDILMEGLNGMEFARKLREMGGEATIVFASSTADFLRQGYEVRAMRYLDKPVGREELRGILLEDYNARFRLEYLSIRDGGNIRRVPVADLMCVEALGRNWVYRLRDESVEVPAHGSFDEAGKNLPGCFVRCHRSYFLNVRCLRSLSKNEAVTVNGMRIPVSKSRHMEVSMAFSREVLLDGDIKEQ